MAKFVDKIKEFIAAGYVPTEYGTFSVRAGVQQNDAVENWYRTKGSLNDALPVNFALGSPQGLGFYREKFTSDPETSTPYLSRSVSDSTIADFIAKNGDQISYQVLRKGNDIRTVYGGSAGVAKITSYTYNETGTFGKLFKAAVLGSIAAVAGYAAYGAIAGGAVSSSAASGAAAGATGEVVGGTGLSLGATSSGAGITAGVSSGAGLVIPTAQTGIIGAGIGASLPALGASAIALSPAAAGASSALGGASTIGKIGSAVSTVKSTIGAAGSVVSTGKQLAAIGGAVGALTGKGGSGTQQAANPPPSSIVLDPVTITGKRLPDYSWALIAALAVSAKFL